jgi:hypothetical protein
MTFLLGVLHLCLPLLIKFVQFFGHFFFGSAGRSRCDQSFQQTMAKDILSQHFVEPLSASINLCVQAA